MEITITTDNFDQLRNGTQPLVVDFWADWCGPCHRIASTVAELAAEYDGKITVGKCSVEDYPEIAAQYGIRNIPTLLFFKQGEVTARHTGAANKTTLKEFFEVNI